MDLLASVFDNSKESELKLVSGEEEKKICKRKSWPGGEKGVWGDISTRKRSCEAKRCFTVDKKSLHI